MPSYIIVDDDVLKLIEDEKRAIVKAEIYKKYEEIQEHGDKIPIEHFYDRVRVSDYRPFIIECNKCRHKTLYFKNISTHKSSGRCTSCQEVDLNHKFEKGLENVRRLDGISKSYSEDDCCKQDINKQIVILLSTILETYMRDFYIGVSNIKFCKNNKNLTSRFLKECRNDFLNPDNTNTRLKNDIWPEWNEDKDKNHVSFKDLLGSVYYGRLKALSAFRNVIVHNNGFVDPTFKNFYDDSEKLFDRDYEIGDPIIITDLIIAGLEMAVEECVRFSNRLYECELRKETARLLVDEYVRKDELFTIIAEEAIDNKEIN